MAGQDRTLGQIGYEAYFGDAAGMSLVSGESLPAWDRLPPRVSQAWEAGARAVAAAVTGAGLEDPELR